MTLLKRKTTENLFGEHCIIILNKQNDILLTMYNNHIEKMIEQNLDITSDSDIIAYLKTNYTKIFDKKDYKFI